MCSFAKNAKRPFCYRKRKEERALSSTWLLDRPVSSTAHAQRYKMCVEGCAKIPTLYTYQLEYLMEGREDKGFGSGFGPSFN